jgi:hypothetical protein
MAVWYIRERFRMNAAVVFGDLKRLDAPVVRVLDLEKSC